MRFKRYSLMLLSLMLVLVSLSGCSGGDGGDAQEASPSEAPAAAPADNGSAPEDGADAIHIGKVSFNINEAYHQAECAWFEQYAAEAGYRVTILDGAADAETMLNNIQDFISSNVDGIVIQPSDNANAEAVVQEVQQAGIPTLTFVNKAESENPHCKLYEAPSAEELGAAAASKWTEWYPDTPIVIAVIDYPASEQVHEERALAFVKGVQSVAPDATVAAMLDGEASRDKSMSCGEDILQAHPEVNMVYGINGNSVMGALAAFEAAGRGRAEDGIPLTELFVGTDGSEQEGIKIYDPDSSLKLTMALSPKNNARAQLDTIISLVSGDIDPTSGYEVEVNDVVMDYWSTPIAEYQAFLTEEYFSTIDLVTELGL